jgi:uncharacterized protein
MMWKFEVYRDEGGNHRWRLRGANGQVVASSGEDFASYADAKEAIENVKANAGTATVVDA